MLEVRATIHQISTYGGSYVNILDILTDGGIGVWGNCLEHPTYLLIRSETWLLVTFDDKEWAKEKLPELIKSWSPDRIISLPSLEDIFGYEQPPVCEVQGCDLPADYEGWHRVLDPFLGTPTGLVQRRNVCEAHKGLLIGAENENP